MCFEYDTDTGLLLFSTPPTPYGNNVGYKPKRGRNITLIYCQKARIPGKNAVLKYSLTGC